MHKPGSCGQLCDDVVSGDPYVTDTIGNGAITILVLFLAPTAAQELCAAASLGWAATASMQKLEQRVRQS